MANISSGDLLHANSLHVISRFVRFKVDKKETTFGVTWISPQLAAQPSMCDGLIYQLWRFVCIRPVEALTIQTGCQPWSLWFIENLVIYKITPLKHFSDVYHVDRIIIAGMTFWAPCTATGDPNLLSICYQEENLLYPWVPLAFYSALVLNKPSWIISIILKIGLAWKT